MTERQLPHDTTESESMQVEGTNDCCDTQPTDEDLALGGWLLKRDVTPHDFPYMIASILQSAYQAWFKDMSSEALSIIGASAVYDYAGSWLAGDESLQVDIKISVALSQCLDERRQVTATEQGTTLVVCPLCTHEGCSVFAAVAYKLSSSMPDGAMTALDAWTHALRSQFYLAFEYICNGEHMHIQPIVEREYKRRDVLYHVVRHMHNRIDPDAVLTQIIESVELLAPGSNIEIYLSQDQHSANPRVKTLILQSWGNPIVMQAFIKGELCYDRSSEGNVEAAFALYGKQGPYGVLKVSFPNKEPDPSDVQLIQLIVEVAGTAFENAKLHEQANEVIQELRFINDLTKRINQSLRLRDVFQDATHGLLRVFEVELCILLQLNSEKKRFEVVSCNLKEVGEAYMPVDEGLFGCMISLREPVIVSTCNECTSTLMHFYEKLGFRSVIAAPLFGGGELVGIVVLADRRSQYFSYENVDLLQMLTTHIGLAIANATLHTHVKHLANKDQLTELYARHYLDKQIDRLQRKDLCGSLIVVDIDYFKKINDTYGHQIGDKILNQVSQIIRSSIRETDIAARWGGEELAIYLPQLTLPQTLRVAERIRTRIVNETDPKVTVSCGIADWNWKDKKISVESLFYQADVALYKAKNGGRNQIQVNRRNDNSLSVAE